jgi:hypothetical protein
MNSSLDGQRSHRKLSCSSSIRLINLYGTDDTEAQLYCDVIETSLKDPLPYEAISYTWQNQRPTCVMHCSAYRSETTLLITENADAALRHFRPKSNGEYRLVWIDSICINQEDDLERGDQVTIMDQIYAMACRVLIWIMPSPTTDSDPNSDYNRRMEVCSWLSDIAHVSAMPDSRQKHNRLVKLIEAVSVEGGFLSNTFMKKWLLIPQARSLVLR